jgi:chromate reductase
MKLLGISGSLRGGSFNTMLVRAAAERFGDATLTMADLNLPLYDGDVEEAEGIPASVTALIEQTAAADAVLISTPEYNKGIPGVLKNALDWMSRVKPMPLTGKPTAIMSAAAGRGGGEVAQFMLRHCLVSHGPRLVSGPMVAVGGASNAFADGALTDEMAQKVVDQQMDALKALIG